MVPDHVQVEPHWDRDASLSEVLDEIIISELGEDPGFDLDSWTSVPRLKLGLTSYLEIVDWLSDVMFYKYSIKILLFLSIQIIQRQTLYLVDIDHHFGDIILKSNFSIYGTRSLYLLVGLVGLIYSFLVFVRELRVLKFLSSQSRSGTGILGQARDLQTPRTGASDIWCAVMGFSGRFCEIVDVIVLSYLASFHLELSQAILLLLVRLSFLAIQLRSLLAVGNISSGFVQSQHPRPGSAGSPQSSALSFRSTTSQDEERIGLSVEIDTESARQHQSSHPPRASPSTATLQSLLADYQDTFVLCTMSQTFFSKGLGFYAHPGFSRQHLRRSLEGPSSGTEGRQARMKPFKVLQLADLAFYLDMLSLESALSRLYIINKHKETHEFNISTYFIWKVLSHNLLMDACKLLFLIIFSRLPRRFLAITLAASSFNTISLFLYLHVNKQVVSDMLR